MLRFFILLADRDAGRQMRDAHRAVGVLTDCPPGPLARKHQSAVFFFDLNVHFFGRAKRQQLPPSVNRPPLSVSGTR